MMIDLTAAVLAFAITARERGHSTPWCVDSYTSEGGIPTRLLFRIGPAQGAAGGIVCAPVCFP